MMMIQTSQAKTHPTSDVDVAAPAVNRRYSKAAAGLTEEDDVDLAEVPSDVRPEDSVYDLITPATGLPKRYLYHAPSEFRHKKAVTAVSIMQPLPSFDQYHPIMISVSEDSYAKVWDLYSMKVLLTFDGHAKILEQGKLAPTPMVSNKIQAVASYAYADEKHHFVVTGGEDKLGIVWDPMTGKEYCRLDGKHGKAISCVSIIHPKNKNNVCEGTPFIILGSYDKSFSIWNYLSKEQVHHVDTGHTDLLLTLTAFQVPVDSTNNQDSTQSRIRIVTGSWDKTIRIWKWMDKKDEVSADGKKVENPQVIGRHMKSVQSVVGHVPSTDGRSYPLLVSGSLDKSCIVWDFNSTDPKPIRSISGHKEKVTTVRIYDNPNDGFPPMVVSASEDGEAIMWDLLTGEKLRVFPHKAGSKVTALDVFTSKYGVMVVTGCQSGALSVWNMYKYDRIRELKTPAVTAIDMYEPRPHEKPHMKPLIVIGTIKNTCTVFEVESGKEVGKLEGHTSRINAAVIYSPSEPTQSPLVITCDGVAAIKVWNLFERKEVRPLVGHSIAVLTLGLYDPRRCHSIPTGGKIDVSRPLVISGGIDKDIRIWDFQDKDGKCVGVLEQKHTNFVRSIAVHHPTTANCDPLFVSGSYDLTAKLWNLRTLELIGVFEGFHKGFVFIVNIYDPIAHLGDKIKRLPEDMQQPLIVTGGYDNVTGVWNMHNRKLLHHLRGHSESVTAQAIYVPKSTDEDPLVITGSIDKLVIVWNLITGERIQTLIGHSDRVCYINIYTPPSGHNPLLCSGGDDEVTILWEDTLYQKKYMPLKDAVIRAFENDLYAEDWPIITEMVKTYGYQVFIENSNLYYLAVMHNRPDFLLKFRSFLTYVLPNMKTFPNSNWMTNTKMVSDSNLLTCAVEVNNLTAVRAILLSWTECLNTDINDMLTQTLYHPSYMFRDKDLKALADLYPQEFINFIVALRLIRNADLVIGEKRKQKIRHPDRCEVVGLSDPAASYDNSWKVKFLSMKLSTLYADFLEVIFNQRKSIPQPVTSLMIPLKNTSTVDMLGLFVEVSNLLDNVDIFASPVGEVSLRFFWESYGRFIHIKAMCKYVCALVLFMFCLYSYQFQFDRDSRKMTVGMHALNGATIAMFCLYFLEEMLQCRAKYQKISKKLQESNDKVSSNKASEGSMRRITFIISHFVADLWNMFDLVIIVSGLIGLVLRIIHERDTVDGRIALAITSVLMWFKVLYFMRPFSNSGPLVAVILRIVYDIRYYLLVLFCVLAGFAQGFWMLSNVDPSGDFGNVRSSLYHAFLTMLGGMTPEFETSMSKSFSIFLLCVFMMTMIIVMLNILIALMGDTFSEVRAKGLALWRREQATIVFDEVFYLHSMTQFKPYIHILKYTSDIALKLPVNALEEMVEASVYHVKRFTHLDLSLVENTNAPSNSAAETEEKDKAHKEAEDKGRKALEVELQEMKAQLQEILKLCARNNNNNNIPASKVITFDKDIELEK